MPMPPYPVICHAPGCRSSAAYKIAARWSDGITNELKTYFLSCRDCLSKLFAEAGVKRAACRLAAGETLEAPGIYELHRGDRDQTRKRCVELERLRPAHP
jgi:predicted CxxxxCH...CXXCH cytochrome family protein